MSHFFTYLRDNPEKLKPGKSMFLSKQHSTCFILFAVLAAGATSASAQFSGATPIGREVAVPRHLQDGEEYQVTLPQLVEHGKKLFTAVWTDQEGGGRPLTKGTGRPLTDPSPPLLFPRTFNPPSAPRRNPRAPSHSHPVCLPRGGGDIVAHVFLLAQPSD